MMNTAFIFPGQGSQYVGMGGDLYEHYSDVQELYSEANEILGFELSCVSFEGPEEQLKQTFITQPAIFVHSVALIKLLSGKINARFAAGHSLGEYSALYYAGALNFKDCLKLVKNRGVLMQEAGEKQKGTMAAIIGLDEKIVDSICQEALSEGIVQVANLNSPGQIVISGSILGVRKAMGLSKLNKAKMVKELIVHGAFHSPLMEPAKNKFKETLDIVKFNKVRIPVYTNVTGKHITEQTSPEEIKRLLYEQLTSPVRWQDCIINMISDGAEEFIELGPGKVLQGLVKRIDSTVVVRGFDKAEDLSTVS